MSERTALIHALKSGDPAALEKLFEMFADRIYRLAFRLTQNPVEAEDVVQETFLKVITHIDQFEGRSNLDTWIYRVSYNASLDRLRQRSTVAISSDSFEQDEDGGFLMPEVLIEWRTPEGSLMQTEDKEILDQAINSLPISLQTVFLLRDIEELSTQETAEVLGIPVNLVKVRLHRARLSLREKLAAHFAENQPF